LVGGLAGVVVAVASEDPDADVPVVVGRPPK